MMKKITSKLLVLMLVFVMAFSLTACGDSSDDQKDNVSSDATSSTNDSSGASDDSQSTDDDNQPADDDKDDSTGSGKYSTLSDYINADEVKETFSSLEKALEGSGMSMKITAEDNTLVYTYKYDEIEKTDEMSKQLEESIKAQDTTFQSVANSIKEYVDVDSASVLIKYVDCNDDEIFSKEYVSE